MHKRSVKMNEKRHLEIWECPVKEIMGEPDEYISDGSEVGMLLRIYGLTEEMVEGNAIVEVGCEG